MLHIGSDQDLLALEKKLGVLEKAILDLDKRIERLYFMTKNFHEMLLDDMDKKSALPTNINLQ